MAKRQILLRGNKADIALFTKDSLEEVQNLSLDVGESGDFLALFDFRSNETLAERIEKDGYFGLNWFSDILKGKLGPRLCHMQCSVANCISFRAKSTVSHPNHLRPRKSSS
jgi:hypothetical protein